MNNLISFLLSRWVLAGSALVFMAPALHPFQHVSIPEHMSFREFLTKDSSLKQAIVQSRAETDKLISKAKTNAGTIITIALHNIEKGG
jgi:hypothetical protein